MVRFTKDSHFAQMDFFDVDAVRFAEPLLISTMAISLCEDIRNHMFCKDVRTNLTKIKNVYGKEINEKVRRRIISHILDTNIIISNTASLQVVLGMNSSRSTSTDLFNESELKQYRTRLLV